jgi:hypothetical protein
MDILGILWAILSLWIAHKLVSSLDTGEDEDYEC